MLGSSVLRPLEKALLDIQGHLANDVQNESLSRPHMILAERAIASWGGVVPRILGSASVKVLQLV